MKFFPTINAAVATCILTRFDGVMAETSQESNEPQWAYHSHDNRMINWDRWAEVWPSCGGDRQSPINIVSRDVIVAESRLPLAFSGICPDFNLSAPHEPLEADVHEGSCEVSVNSTVFKLTQFHLHAPAEHTIDGVQKNGEIHFVHRANDSDALLVVGIILEISPVSDPWLNPLLDALEHVNSTVPSESVIVQLSSYANLIKTAFEIGGAYNYPGSLTTPGCAETVDWWVIKSPIMISVIDYDRLHTDLLEYEITNNGNNARPVQPLQGRTVLYYTPTAFGLDMYPTPKQNIV
ncbi:putative alpha carbonic anhydrase domain, carbonic anhydrase, alpha-class [Plasmopara halstedii]